MKLVVGIFLFIFLIEFILASCNDGQIDINSASLEELQEITQIGPAYAEQIINLRPFDSVDELTRVSGIAEGRLSKIKEENLACVENSDIEENEIKPEEEKKTEDKESETKDNIEEENQEQILESKLEIKEEPSKKETELKAIELNSISSQTIKSENYTEDKSKSDYAVYGLAGFCVLLCFLFVLRKNKYRKNEFR